MFRIDAYSLTRFTWRPLTQLLNDRANQSRAEGSPRILPAGSPRVRGSIPQAQDPKPKIPRGGGRAGGKCKPRGWGREVGGWVGGGLGGRSFLKILNLYFMFFNILIPYLRYPRIDETVSMVFSTRLFTFPEFQGSV